MTSGSIPVGFSVFEKKIENFGVEAADCCQRAPGSFWISSLGRIGLEYDRGVLW